MPRLFRQVPLLKRLVSVFNVIDGLLWLSEELETRDWDSKAAGINLGVALNLIFCIARANTGNVPVDHYDDVFGDGSGGQGWASFLANTSVWLLALFSLANAFYAMTRSRQYRLFEANVETAPPTPSAQRVHVQSSPASSSPIRFLTSAISSETAESREHPDVTRHVWELSVWDPLPISMGIFGLFSPLHVLVYCVFLPLLPLDPRPSVSAFCCLLLQAMVSCQLLVLQSMFSRQSKDTTLIHKEVMREYDTKYVHPRLHPIVRDVATQVCANKSDGVHDSVEIGTPTTIIRRGFQTNPNPNYSSYYSPDGLGTSSPGPSGTSISRVWGTTRPEFLTPTADLSRQSSGRWSSIARVTPPTTTTTVRSVATGSSVDFGGSMGVYRHANSPLKKTISLSDMHGPSHFSPRNSREMAALEQSDSRRQSSPVRPDTRLGDRWPPVNPFKPQYERYPSRV